MVRLKIQHIYIYNIYIIYIYIYIIVFFRYRHYSTLLQIKEQSILQTKQSSNGKFNFHQQQDRACLKMQAFKEMLDNTL